jgi:hypothetical protein
MDQPSNSVFDNSIHQPWVYFCCRFDASVVNSLTLSITYVGCHSVFIDDFKVYSDYFRWRFMDHPSHNVFDNSMRQPWVYFCYRFDVSIVNSLKLSITCVGCYSPFIDDYEVYSDSVFAVDLWISKDIAFLTIPCVGYDLLHTAAVTQYSLMISRSTMTLFLLMIYGSVQT